MLTWATTRKCKHYVSGVAKALCGPSVSRRALGTAWLLGAFLLTRSFSVATHVYRRRAERVPLATWGEIAMDEDVDSR
jgi:hypothetical protein